MDPDHKTRKSEARRGAQHAREILAGNPTIDRLLTAWHWSWDESDQNTNGSPSIEYDRAFRAVLRPHMPPWRSLRGR